MDPLAPWPDHAAVRLVPAAPPLDADAAAGLVTAIGKLFDQFVREGRCRAGGAAPLADGAVLAIVWDGPPLSGCSHDKLNGIMALHERDGRRLLAAPPIVLLDPPRCLDRPGLRAAVAAGAAGPETPMLDLSATTVAAWRSTGRTTLGNHPLGRIVLRHAAG
jgi:hypothetical protein